MLDRRLKTICMTVLEGASLNSIMQLFFRNWWMEVEVEPSSEDYHLQRRFSYKLLGFVASFIVLAQSWLLYRFE